jgi:KaiC/GvpD/RAD55 family RecA-like ATPase
MENILHLKESIKVNIEEKCKMIYQAKKQSRDEVYEQTRRFSMDRKKIEESLCMDKMMRA